MISPGSVRRWTWLRGSVVAPLVMLTLIAPRLIAAAPAGDLPQAARQAIPSAGAPPFVKQFEETSYYLEDVAFVTKDMAWAAGQVHWDNNRKQYVGTIVKSTDGGETWTPHDAGVNESLRGLSVLDEKQGWAVGANGTIVHSADGGLHWSKQAVDTSDDFRDVVFVDANNGWATSIKTVHRDERTQEPDDWQGSIWHTGDGGTTWVRQSLPEGASLLNRLDFVDEKRGWAVGLKRVGQDALGPKHSAAIYRTTDGGQHWNWVDTGVEGPLGWSKSPMGDLEFTDAQHGVVAGGAGLVLGTEDGGAHWSKQELVCGYPSCNFPLYALDLFEERHGGIAGQEYFYTSDGGARWSMMELPFGTTVGLYDIQFTGAQQGWMVGDHGVVVHSGDGGHFWKPVQSGLLDPLFGLYFVNPQRGWFVGDYGSIVRYSSSEAPTGPAQFLSPIWRPGQAASLGPGLGVQIIYVP